MSHSSEPAPRARRDAILTLEVSEEELGRLRQAAESLGIDPCAFALEAALARAASELSEDYVTRISPEGMARWLQFQASMGAQRPLRPREAAFAYAQEAARPVGALPNSQRALPFDEALPPALAISSPEGH